MIKLTLRDYKILAELDKNSKASYNSIGKKLRLSPSVVERRIKNMIRKEVIIDFKSIINYKRLGWTYYSIYAKFQNITEGKKKEMLNYLKKHNLSGQVLLCDGRWQLVYGFFAKNIFELTNYLKEFNNLFGPWLSETNKVIHIGSHHYYRGYFLNKKLLRENEPFLGGPETTLKIDSEAYEILNLIRQNARLSIVDLADKIKISIEQVRYRLKKLSKEKILLGSWLNISPRKFGLNFYRILLKLKNMDIESEREFLNYMNLNKNVIRTNNVFGSWDYFVDLEISTEDFRKFMEDFTKRFTDKIQEYETLMIYEEVNYTFSPIFN